MAVKLGAVDRADYSIRVPVVRKIFHKDFQPEPIFFNDIGLLELDNYALREEYINSKDGKYFRLHTKTN